VFRFEKVDDWVRNRILRTQSMTDDDFTFLPLRVTRVGVGGKRSFDPPGKQRPVDAYLQPGLSLSGLALKARGNASKLRKWVHLREQFEQSNALVKEGGMTVTRPGAVAGNTSR
jgi:hypothetical protein